MKLLMSLALVTAERGQRLPMLDITLMRQDESVFVCLLLEHIKQSRPGYTPTSIVLHALSGLERFQNLRHSGHSKQVRMILTAKL